MKAIISGIFLFLLSAQPICAQLCRDVEINAVINRTIPDCNRSDGEIIVVRTTGGTEPYTYQLDTAITQTGAFFDLPVGLYTLLITDSRGCQESFEVDLTYKELDQIIRPYNTFTPNGDDMNDTWVIRGIESFQSSEVNVYNKWGQQAHLNSPYNNEFGWDGRQNGSDLPEGTYFYVITVFNNCQEESIAGTVNIIR